MKNLTLLILLFLSISVFAKTDNNSFLLETNARIIALESNQTKYDSAYQRMTDLVDKYECQDRSNEKTITSISAQIGAASTNLTVFGIIFAILAILLGIYISNIEKKVIKIKEENELLLQKTIKTKNDAESINESIQKNISDVYLKIKREETVHILRRLSNIPEDIINFLSSLLSRELEREDFTILRDAYYKIGPEEEVHTLVRNLNKSESYRLIFFQHFLDQAILDDKIGNDLIGFYPHAIRCAFEIDMIKSTNDFIRAIMDNNYLTKTEVINDFFKGLTQSKHKNFLKIYAIMFNGIGNRNDQFRFFDIITDNDDCKIGKFNYGCLLINNYGNSVLTVSESATIEKIKLIESQIDDAMKSAKE